MYPIRKENKKTIARETRIIINFFKNTNIHKYKHDTKPHTTQQ
jgi:hypothetical protein